MANPRRYTVLPDLPHLPADVLAPRLARHSRPAPGGCRIWTGSQARANRADCAPILRVPTPDGGSKCLFAHKLAWYLVHGIYPVLPHELWQGCGTKLCIEASHLTLRLIQERRGLSDAQVLQIRSLFWRPRARLNEFQQVAKAPSAEQLAAWALGLNVATVKAALSGRRICPQGWDSFARSREDVQRVVDLHRPQAEQRARDRAAILSIETLAKRFGSTLHTIHRVVHGLSYQHLPMPKEANARYRKEVLAGLQAERDAQDRALDAQLHRMHLATLSPTDVALATLTTIALPPPDPAPHPGPPKRGRPGKLAASHPAGMR